MLSCSTPSRDQAVVIPTDGVHITGAINTVYPIESGGTCYLNVVTGVQQLSFTGNADVGHPTLNLVLRPFAGPFTYTNLRWPPGEQSSLSVGLRGDLTYVASSGRVVVTAVHGGTVVGTVSATNMRERNAQTKDNASAAGSWTCQIVVPQGLPEASPSPSPIVYPSPSPPPVGTPVARQVLPPATVLPLIDLCSSPVQVFQDGNAGPLFCSSGALNVLAWRFFAQLNPVVMSLGPSATLADVEGALCAGAGGENITLPQEDSAYSLAAAYNDWVHGVAHGFDDSAFLIGGGCH